MSISLSKFAVYNVIAILWYAKNKDVMADLANDSTRKAETSV